MHMYGKRGLNDSFSLRRLFMLRTLLFDYGPQHMHILRPEPNISIAYTHHVAQQPPTASPPRSLTFSYGPTILKRPQSSYGALSANPPCRTACICGLVGLDEQSSLSETLCSTQMIAILLSNMACIVSNAMSACSSTLYQSYIQSFQSSIKRDTVAESTVSSAVIRFAGRQ